MRFVLASRNLVNSTIVQGIAAKMLIRCVFVIRTFVCKYTSAWASMLFVQTIRLYQSLEKRNSNNAVPLFVCIWEWLKIYYF